MNGKSAERSPLTLFVEGLRSVIELKLQNPKFFESISSWDKIIVIRIIDTGSVTITFKAGGKITTVEGENHDPRPDIVLEGDWSTFMKISQGKMSAIRGYFTRKMKRIKGSLNDVRKLAKFFQIPKE